MTKKRNFRDERAMLRAVLQASSQKRSDLRWEYLTLEADALKEALEVTEDNAEIIELAKQFANNTIICRLRTDPISLRIKGFEKRFSRQSIAEGIGALGTQFFPARRIAYRAAYEAAREAIYFGYGSWDAQFLEDSVSQFARLLRSHTKGRSTKGVILRDIREGFETDHDVLDILHYDQYFQHEGLTKKDFLSFQDSLRSMPFDGALVEKLSSSFNKRATIGVRDGLRWFLGSRHPWFSWTRARELISEAFKNHSKENYNTPQIVYYTWDPHLEEEEIQKRIQFNDQVVEAFAKSLKDALSFSPAFEKLDIVSLSRWILDIHHDYPDFDLESTGALGAETQIAFLGHSIQDKMSQDFLGEEAQTRRNYKIEEHFKANRLITRYLSSLLSGERQSFFETVDKVLKHYAEQGGVVLSTGIREYDRIPCSILVVQDAGQSQPLAGEKLLASFDFSEMTQLEHASYMRSFQEISEKLVVFFTLVLRHTIDTQHAPDLRPKDIVKDFLFLGLWGTRSENIRIHLYSKDNGSENIAPDSLSRSEIRFVGMDQIETHPFNELREEAKIVRFLASQVSPLIEPSIIRMLGTFTMAMEEFRTGNRAQNLDAFSLMRYGIDISREAIRYVVKGNTTKLINVFEFALDNSLDVLQNQVDKLEHFKNKPSKDD